MSSLVSVFGFRLWVTSEKCLWFYAGGPSLSVIPSRSMHFSVFFCGRQCFFPDFGRVISQCMNEPDLLEASKCWWTFFVASWSYLVNDAACRLGEYVFANEGFLLIVIFSHRGPGGWSRASLVGVLLFLKGPFLSLSIMALSNWRWRKQRRRVPSPPFPRWNVFFVDLGWSAFWVVWGLTWWRFDFPLIIIDKGEPVVFVQKLKTQWASNRLFTFALCKVAVFWIVFNYIPGYSWNLHTQI